MSAQWKTSDENDSISVSGYKVLLFEGGEGAKVSFLPSLNEMSTLHVLRVWSSFYFPRTNADVGEENIEVLMNLSNALCVFTTYMICTPG